MFFLVLMSDGKKSVTVLAHKDLGGIWEWQKTVDFINLDGTCGIILLTRWLNSFAWVAVIMPSNNRTLHWLPIHVIEYTMPMKDSLEQCCSLFVHFNMVSIKNIFVGGGVKIWLGSQYTSIIHFFLFYFLIFFFPFLFSFVCL